MAKIIAVYADMIHHEYGHSVPAIQKALTRINEITPRPHPSAPIEHWWAYVDLFSSRLFDWFAVE
jgi:hypothetical protein